MSRFFSLLLLLFTLSQCVSPQYACIDLTQKKKKDFRHSRIKKHFVAPDNQQALESPDSQIEEYPFLASKRQASEAEDLLLGDLPELGSLQRIAESRDAKKELTSIESRRIEQLKARVAEVMPPDMLGQMIQVQDTSITKFDEVYKEAKTLAFVSFWSSIASILALSVPVLIFPLITVGIVTGLTSLKRYKKAFNKKYKGFAIAGLVISSGWLALLIAVFIALILLFAGGGW